MQQAFHRLDSQHHSAGPHITSGLPKVVVEITRGRARHKIRPVLVRAFLIGSAPECDLVLGDLQFGGIHAYLLRDPRGVSLRCLESAPETTVNGQPVRRAELKDQDRVRTGPYEFTVRVTWPADRQSTRDSSAFGKMIAGKARR